MQWGIERGEWTDEEIQQMTVSIGLKCVYLKLKSRLFEVEIKQNYDNNCYKMMI